MLGKANIACQLYEGRRISVQRHNELAKENRHLLSRITDCIKLCGGHNLALPGSDGKHLASTHITKHRSKMSQNELLDYVPRLWTKTG